jgi:uncharacterized membrane protein
MLPLAKIDLYSISVFVHIAAVVVGFGATYALALTFPVAQRMDNRHLPYVHALGIAVSRYLATPALVVVLATGMYQVADDPGDAIGFGDPWVSASFLIVIVLGGLIGGYFIPTDRRLGAQVKRDLRDGGEPSADYLRGAKQSGAVGALAGVLVLVAIFLMTTKPGA